MWLEHLVCHYYYELKFLRKIRQFWWYHSINLGWSVHKNKTIPIHSLESLICPYYYDKLKFSQKWSSFVEVMWKFELLILQNSADFMKSLENFRYPYYHELKLLQKYLKFNEFIWTFELPPLSWGIIFSKVKPFWWCLLKMWPSPITTRRNFCLNKAILICL